MTEQTANVITAAMTLLGSIFAGILTYLMARLNKKTEAQNTKLDAIVETGDKVHVLVNSSMLAQLKLNAESAHRIANLTKDPADFDAAINADNLLKEHERSQKIVDLKERKAEAKTEI